MKESETEVIPLHCREMLRVIIWLFLTAFPNIMIGQNSEGRDIGFMFSEAFEVYSYVSSELEYLKSENEIETWYLVSPYQLPDSLYRFHIPFKTKCVVAPRSIEEAKAMDISQNSYVIEAELIYKSNARKRFRISVSYVMEKCIVVKKIIDYTVDFSEDDKERRTSSKREVIWQE